MTFLVVELAPPLEQRVPLDQAVKVASLTF